MTKNKAFEDNVINLYYKRFDENRKNYGYFETCSAELCLEPSHVDRNDFSLARTDINSIHFYTLPSQFPSKNGGPRTAQRMCFGNFF